MVYTQTILRISMEESAIIAILYDEIMRKAWARKTVKGEKVELLQEASEKSLPTLELSKSRLKIVARATGLTEMPGPN